MLYGVWLMSSRFQVGTMKHLGLFPQGRPTQVVGLVGVSHLRHPTKAGLALAFGLTALELGVFIHIVLLMFNCYA